MKHCLIIEDNEFDREIIETIVTKLGMKFLAEDNGFKAIIHCRDRLPDIIFVDLIMPEINGIEFVAHIRNLPNGDKPFIVMCTGMDANKQIKEELKSSINAYVTKPFDITTIEKTLTKAGML